MAICAGKPEMGRTTRDLAADVRMLEALLCTLLARAGGAVILPAHQVADCGNRCRFGIRPNRRTQTLTLTAQPIRPGSPPRPVASDLPRR
jgi:hypothetical protein